MRYDYYMHNLYFFTIKFYQFGRNARHKSIIGYILYNYAIWSNYYIITDFYLSQNFRPWAEHYIVPTSNAIFLGIFVS